MKQEESLIEISTIIAKTAPWEFLTKNKNLIFNYAVNHYFNIEILNNGWNIYIGNNNIYEHQEFIRKEKLIQNSYGLEKLRKYSYASLEFYSFKYLYPISMDKPMIELYDNLDINLDKNFKYINYFFKGKGQSDKLISLKQINQLLSLLNIFLEFILEYTEKKLNYTENDKVLFVQRLVDSNEHKIIITEKYYYEINLKLTINDMEKYLPMVKVNKVIDKTLLIDMRYITFINEKQEYYPLVLTAYDDTDEILHFPFVCTKGIDIEAIINYIKRLIPNRMYGRIVVYNVDLYLILRYLFFKYKIIVVYEDQSDILDCIYDDYEEIIYNNGL